MQAGGPTCHGRAAAAEQRCPALLARDGAHRVHRAAVPLLPRHLHSQPRAHQVERVGRHDAQAARDPAGQHLGARVPQHGRDARRPQLELEHLEGQELRAGVGHLPQDVSRVPSEEAAQPLGLEAVPPMRSQHPELAN